MSGLPLLSILIWGPIAGGGAVLALGSGGRARAGKFVALIISVLTFVLSVLLYMNFDLTTAQMQFVELVPWITQFNAYYYLGLDGISLPLILLTTFLTPLVVLAGWEVIKLRPAQYFASFLILEGLMIGAFAATSLPLNAAPIRETANSRASLMPVRNSV